MEKIKKLKWRLALLYTTSLVVSIFPLALTLFIKRSEYITTVTDALRLSAGLAVGVIFMIIKVLGKMKMPRRLTLYVIITLMAYLLKPLLSDMVLLGAMAILGEVCDSAFFGMAIKRTRQQISDERTASSTADKVEEVFKKYMGGEK